MTVIREAAERVRDGHLVVVPTDTVYGIGTRPDDPAATARLFTAKGRPSHLELPILVPDEGSAAAIAAFDARAYALAAAFWPGALTMVLPRTQASTGWELGGDAGTIGVRIPGHPLALALLAATGPMAVTSANPSGKPPLTTCEELTGTFGDLVAVYLCEDTPLVGTASTVIDLRGPSVEILREGAVTRTRILQVLSAGD